jgi:hypothetical protein
MADYDSFPRQNASKLYSTLHDTAIAFIDSTSQDPNKLNRIDESRIRVIRSSNFTHSWGHNYLVSTTPEISSTLDVEGFIGHMKRMTPSLESWETDVTDVMVDEARRRVIVRASYWIEPKGVEKMENDLIWFLDLVEEDGEWKVSNSVEFIDGIATAKLMELMMGKKG